MSLREQFLKSGLVTKKQANKVDAQKKREEHVQKKDTVLMSEAIAKKQSEIDAIATVLDLQKQKDKELNKLRDEILAKREQIYRAKQIINVHGQNQAKTEDPYFFTENNFIRKIYVTLWQREMLARGALAIVKPNEHFDEFLLLQRSHAKIILDICPEKIIVLHSEIENFQDFFQQ